MEEQDLAQELKELKKRIGELEAMISQAVRPIQDMQTSATRYLRLVEIILQRGGLSPDMLVPEARDPISRDIVCVLVNKGYQNISQITEGVRAKRGSASRRIVRQRLHDLEENGAVKRTDEKLVATYYLSDEVVTRWSKLLGIPI
ncbi:MAG: hypothetical protein PHW58_03865 [Candidatus Methanofastidiosa archaeon]|nr:hypothetical protein [Candidatus Methanofastidiosa archaeon]